MSIRTYWVNQRSAKESQRISFHTFYFFFFSMSPTSMIPPLPPIAGAMRAGTSAQPRLPLRGPMTRDYGK